jgi:Flp pilus assembly protein TadG
MRRTAEPRPARRRSGATLVHFALVLPVLLGMIGLVLDGGILLATYRQVQNAADAAATSAAMDLYRGATSATATTTANSFMANNGMSGLTLTLNGGSSNALNIPPQDPGGTGSPYTIAANPSNVPLNPYNYVEAVVTRPVTTMFVQAIGVNKNQQVTARAVAGFEPVGSGEGAIVLDPSAVPGIDFKGNNAQLLVYGTVVVNSKGGGIDQYGQPVTTLDDGSTPLSGVAVATHATPSIIARDIQVVGGVDTLDNFRAYDPAFSPSYYDPSNTDRPVFARAPIALDPLLSLPTPNSSNNLYNQVNPAPSGTTYSPGIYTNGISITGDATFSPGIYVISGGNLSLGGSGTITGNGVMFYFTNSTYNPATGQPDASDGSTKGSVSGATLSMSGSPTVTLTPYNNASSPFNGMLLYQRRWNTSVPKLTGNGTSVALTGTIYAKWANFDLAGQGTYSAQFVVGSLLLSGNGLVTINATGKNFGKANLVFLVE